MLSRHLSAAAEAMTIKNGYQYLHEFNKVSEYRLISGVGYERLKKGVS